MTSGTATLPSRRAKTAHSDVRIRMRNAVPSHARQYYPQGLAGI
jgi:hypothetical protein